MSEFTQYVPASTPRGGPPAPAGGGSGLRLAAIFFFVAGLIFVALTSFLAWRWVDGNLLHWGVKDGTTQEVNTAELLQRVQAFELATVKHTYAGKAHVESEKVLSAGPKRVTLPGFIAGQQLDATGKVVITAGVDLSRVRPEDMEVARQGKDVHITIRVPSPEIQSAALLPNTLDFSTSAGMLTRIGQAAGLSQTDLRERAADQVTQVAKDTALQQGILDDAAREAERRLQAFLQSLPQTGDMRITYSVVTRQPSVQ